MNPYLRADLNIALRGLTGVPRMVRAVKLTVMWWRLKRANEQQMLGNVYLPSTPDWALEVSEGLYKAFRRRYTDRLATTPQEIAAVKEFQASNRLKYKMLMSIKE